MAFIQQPVVAKRYANRRLYKTAAGRYPGLEDLAAMVEAEEDIVIDRATTGDITRSLLNTVNIIERAGHG